MFAILAPKGVVYPYNETAKAYLQAGASANVGDYQAGVKNPQVPVCVEWRYDGEADYFCIAYGRNADFSDAFVKKVGGKRRFLPLYNLWKASKYFVRVTAFSAENGALESVTGEFETTELGPRVMNVDGIYNVRDLGGHETCFGKRIVQGIAYRGGSLTPPPKDIFDSNLSSRGKKMMRDELGIKTEIDLRGYAEAGIEGGSVIPEAMLIYARVDGYDSAMKSWQEAYRVAFSYFADANHYPIYFHCTGGADRTGTITFLLHALLGVDETTCIQDYEFTSFSVFGERNAKTGHWATYFQPFYQRLMAFEGETLQEKTEQYFLSIGITAAQIASIKAIFFGETPIVGKRAFRITAPQGIVYPYMDAAKAYLQAGEGANVIDYAPWGKNPQRPISIRWTYAEKAVQFCVEYGLKADFSDAVSVMVSGKKRAITVDNLYKAAKYYVRVTALAADGGAMECANGEFLTAELGPRVMHVDDIYNVRDLGGYQTAFGKRTKQGIAYRGGALVPRPRDVIFHRLTKKGKQTLAALGIKGELDFRDEAEAGVPLNKGSSIPGATLTYCTVGSYAGLLTTHQETCRKIFAYLADVRHYPLYCHCSAGADRTGSVCFLLLALLGVSETECVQDYEFTSFSIYDERNAKAGSWGKNFQEYRAILDGFAGETLQERVENFLLSIGVTAQEIAAIKGIFFGEIPLQN